MSLLEIAFASLASVLCGTGLTVMAYTVWLFAKEVYNDHKKLKNK